MREYLLDSHVVNGLCFSHPVHRFRLPFGDITMATSPTNHPSKSKFVQPGGVLACYDAGPVGWSQMVKAKVIMGSCVLLLSNLMTQLNKQIIVLFKTLYKLLQTTQNLTKALHVIALLPNSPLLTFRLASGFS